MSATYRDTGYDAPPAMGAAVTPDDANDLTTAARYLYVGGAGDVCLVTVGGSTLTFKAVPVGTTLRVRTARVKVTGTTATQILALW